MNQEQENKGTLRITEKGSAWVREHMRQSGISPEDQEKILQRIGDEIREILSEYRRYPLITVMKALRDEKLGSAKEVVKNLLNELGLK